MQSVKGLMKGRWAIWSIAALCAVIAAVGVLTILGNLNDRVSYYVMKSPVAARAPITVDVVEEVAAPASAVPATALSQSDLATGKVFAKVALTAGDPVTATVAGPLTPITYDLPQGYVAASIQIAPERAVGGKISSGDYIDIATAVNQRSRVVMQNILVLDVTVNPSSIASAATTKNSGSSKDAPGPNSGAVRGGIPRIYTLALSPDNFAKLALLNESNTSLALTTGKAPSSLDAESDINTMMREAAKDGGTGTEDVFSGNPQVPGANPSPAPQTPQVAPPATTQPPIIVE